jgi:hypothetical protein
VERQIEGCPVNREHQLSAHQVVGCDRLFGAHMDIGPGTVVGADLHHGEINWARTASDLGKMRREAGIAADQFFALLKGFAFWPQVIGIEPPPSTNERKLLIEGAVTMFLTRYPSTD